MLSHRFSHTLKRVRIWDCGLSPSEALLQSGDKTLEVSFDACMARLFNTLEDRQGLLELDLQYVDLGPCAVTSLGHLLLSIKSLKRLTYIAEISTSSEDLGASIVTCLEGNKNNCQLDSLVLYGLDLSTFEVGRSLAWFIGR